MLRKRADDTEEAIKKRVEWYDRDVMPAVEFFRKNSYYNMHEINGEQLIENVSADIIESVFNSKNHA